jgi:hypothetical protein
MIQALLQTEIGQVVGAGLVAQKSGEFFVLLDEGVTLPSECVSLNRPGLGEV